MGGDESDDHDSQLSDDESDSESDDLRVVFFQFLGVDQNFTTGLDIHWGNYQKVYGAESEFGTPGPPTGSESESTNVLPTDSE